MNLEAAVICSEGKPKYWVILPYIDFFGSAPEGIINLNNFRSPKPEMWRMGEFVLRYFRKFDILNGMKNVENWLYIIGR